MKPFYTRKDNFEIVLAGILLSMVFVWRHAGVAALAALLLIASVLWQASLRAIGEGGLTIAFLDVGQGDAIFIESPTGTQILIDGGPDSSVIRGLSRVLPFYDRSLDMLLVSNPDQDHFAGFIDVLARYDVALVVEPGVAKDSSAYRRFRERVQAEGAAHIVASRGMVFDLGEGTALRILFPDRDAAALEPNTGSIVALLEYGETAALFPGDAPKAVENFVASLDGARLRSDILKVGHHGSKTSTGDALLAAALPSYAVISSGKNNRYGHPHKEVLDTLARFGVEVLRTDTSGTIIFASDGASFRTVR